MKLLLGLVPILVICFLAPLRLEAANLRDDPLLQPPLPKDPSAPPSAGSILSPPPLFPDLVEEASRPEEADAPSHTQHREHSNSSPSQQGRSQYHPSASGRTPLPAPATRGGHRLQKLQRKLGLTPRQVAMIKPIIARAGRRLKALREDPGLAASEKRYYARQIYASSFRQIRPFLTSRQLRKWRELREERRAAVARA